MDSLTGRKRGRDSGDGDKPPPPKAERFADTDDEEDAPAAAAAARSEADDEEEEDADDAHQDDEEDTDEEPPPQVRPLPTLSGFLKSAPSLPLVVPGDDVLQGIIAGGGAASRLFVPVLFLTNKFEKMDTDAVIQMSFQTSMRGYDDFDTATDVIDNDPDFTPNHTAVVFEIPAIENVTYFVRRQENGEMIKTVMSGPAVSYANFQVQRMQYKLAKPPRTNQNVTIITLNGVIPTKVEDRQPYFYFPSWDVVFNPPSRMARFSLLGFDDRTIISVVPFWEKHRVLVLMSEIGDLDANSILVLFDTKSSKTIHGWDLPFAASRIAVSISKETKTICIVDRRTLNLIVHTVNSLDKLGDARPIVFQHPLFRSLVGEVFEPQGSWIPLNVSPDGKYMIAHFTIPGDDRFAKPVFYNLGERFVQLVDAGGVQAVCWSPCSKFFAVASLRSVEIFSVMDVAHRLLSINFGPAFSPFYIGNRIPPELVAAAAAAAVEAAATAAAAAGPAAATAGPAAVAALHSTSVDEEIENNYNVVLSSLMVWRTDDVIVLCGTPTTVTSHHVMQIPVFRGPAPAYHAGRAAAAAAADARIAGEAGGVRISQLSDPTCERIMETTTPSRMSLSPDGVHLLLSTDGVDDATAAGGGDGVAGGAAAAAATGGAAAGGGGGGGEVGEDALAPLPHSFAVVDLSTTTPTLLTRFDVPALDAPDVQESFTACAWSRNGLTAYFGWNGATSKNMFFEMTFSS